MCVNRLHGLVILYASLYLFGSVRFTVLNRFYHSNSIHYDSHPILVEHELLPIRVYHPISHQVSQSIQLS